MRSRTARVAGLGCAVLVLGLGSHQAASDSLQPPADPLVAGFEQPPPSARPRVWWHWMDGNVTAEGIRLDLEWMHRVGVGGAQVFEAGFGTPPLMAQRLIYMTPAWKAAFESAARQADALGLELAIANSPGFSESGGPWVEPADGMKKLVWATTRVEGGRPFKGSLAKPPTTVGPYQDVPTDRSAAGGGGGAPASAVPDLYQDVAVVAYRLPSSDPLISDMRPRVTSSAGPIDAGLLWDGRYANGVSLPLTGEPAWVRLDFGRPITLQSMSLGLADLADTWGTPRVDALLETSDDDIHYRWVASAYDSRDTPLGYLPPNAETVSFRPVRARYFRLRLPSPPAPVDPAWVAAAGHVPHEHQITELRLSVLPRVNQFERKAGYFLSSGIAESPTPPVAARDVIRRGSVIDLKSRLRQDGRLDWTPPPGHWEVLRLGYSLTGVTNEAASPEGTGLEVDKLDARAVRADMEHYLSAYQEFLGPALMGARGLTTMVTDSYEAGPQNWTPSFPEEFLHRRGYDLRGWLPALAGRILDSAEATDRFLWDFRRTLGELMIDAHYGEIAAALRARGMTHYGESHESSRAFLGDGMEAKREVDVPMGAMWMPGFAISQERGDADLRESASVAHVYGQHRVAAESMTVFGAPGRAYAYAPEDLKATADREMADGLNLFVVHTSVHQPVLGVGPGATLGPFGQWFTRQETWADLASPWVSYLARSSYLLQQGRFVADLLYFYGQDSNITALFPDHLPGIPSGYAFDFVSAEAVKRLHVEQGMLVAPSGEHYRILVLDPRTRSVSFDVLQALAGLVESGARIVGDRPRATPSLADDPARFRALAAQVWGERPDADQAYGAGHVWPKARLAEAFTALKLAPDLRWRGSASGASLRYVHRHLDEADLYFVSNPLSSPQEGELDLRVDATAAELWHADTGAREATLCRQRGGVTTVPLRLAPSEAEFVVLKNRPSELSLHRQVGAPRAQRALDGPWDVEFSHEFGGPGHVAFSRLFSWGRAEDRRVRFYSGKAVYRKDIDIPEDWLAAGRRVVLDLGSVKVIAAVTLNDRPVGIAWKAPFGVDITHAVHSGVNHLAITVANLWVNRLIGDRQPGTTPVAIATYNPYEVNSPLLDSGLLGPVMLQSIEAPVETTPFSHRRTCALSTDQEDKETR